MKNDEKINWLSLGTSIMSAFFVIIDLLCAIQISGIIFKVAFIISSFAQINALVYVIKDSKKEYRQYYITFIINYCIANVLFAIIYIQQHTLGSICAIMAAILLIVLVVFKNIKEERTLNIATVIAILQIINIIFLITNGFEIKTAYSYGKGFLISGTYATPLVMSLVQIQMIRSKYIDKKSRGSD